MDPQLFFEQFAHWQHLHSTILLTTEHRGTKRARKWSQNIESPMQSVCRISWCVFASIYDVIKGMDGEHLISRQFHFSVFHNIWSMDIPTCQTSGPLFWSPRVDLVLRVKWHIRLYSCTFRQTCISLPSLLKKTCSCSYMRHIYNYTYIWCIWSLHKSLRDLQSLLYFSCLVPTAPISNAAICRHYPPCLCSCATFLGACLSCRCEFST